VIPLGLNNDAKPGYHVTISVGGAKARPFLLDTGSSGLWVYPNAIGKHRSTTYAVTNSYGSGIVYDGVLAYTQVDFGNGIVTRDVPVALVTKATCKSGKVCPAQPGSSYCPSVKPGPNAGVKCLESGRQLYGTFGAALAAIPVPSTNPVDELYNVIFAIAQPWAHAFAVTPGALVVGEQSLKGYTTMRLTSATVPKPLPNGARAWERDVQLCYTVGTLKHQCFASLFDTGASNVSFQADVKLPLVPSANCGDQVKPGTPFAVQTEDGTTIASFKAGSLTNWNRIVAGKTKTTPQVNTGMTLFNRNTIYYDAKTGIVAIRPLHPPTHTAQSGCGTLSS